MPFLRAARIKKNLQLENERPKVILTPFVDEQTEPEEELAPVQIEDLHRLIDIRTKEAERAEEEISQPEEIIVVVPEIIPDIETVFLEAESVQEIPEEENEPAGPGISQTEKESAPEILQPDLSPEVTAEFIIPEAEFAPEILQPESDKEAQIETAAQKADSESDIAESETESAQDFSQPDLSQEISAEAIALETAQPDLAQETIAETVTPEINIEPEILQADSSQEISAEAIAPETAQPDSAQETIAETVTPEINIEPEILQADSSQEISAEIITPEAGIEQEFSQAEAEQEAETGSTAPKSETESETEQPDSSQEISAEDITPESEIPAEDSQTESESSQEALTEAEIITPESENESEIAESEAESADETETITPETEQEPENSQAESESEAGILQDDSNTASSDFDENSILDEPSQNETPEPESEAEEESHEQKPEDSQPAKSHKDYSGSHLNYDFTSGERYVDKVSTKTEFDKMLDELANISKELLSWQADKFARDYTGKFQEGESSQADARKYEAFLGGYITNAAMLLYDKGYRDAAIKQLEQAKSILEARKKLEDETSAIKSRVEEQNDVVDLSDILGIFGDA